MALTEAQKRNAEKNRQYWADREEEALKHYIKEEAEYDKQIQKIYKDMLDSCNEQINAFYGQYASKEGITLAEAKKRVKSLDIEKYERKAAKYVKEKDFSDKANEEMRLYNATMKINRLEMLKANIGLETIAGHNELEKFMEKILRGRTEAELARQAGILGKTVLNNAKLAHTIPNASFHSGTFSDRIWQYQDLMRGDLEKLLTRGLIQGKNARALTADLRKYLIGDKNGKGATYNVERLMRTELARVQTEAQKQSFVRNGFTQYKFHVNGGCCDICEGLKGKVFDVDKMMPGENAPPMHPHCRCSTSAYSDRKEYDEWLDFLEKGGTTEEWNKLRKTLDKSGKMNIIKAAASELPSRFKKYLPENKRRLQIIEEGKNLDKPIFDSGLLGKLAKGLKPMTGYYDVVLHGTEYGLRYFGESIDVETLCAIIAQRKDYQKGTKIRLIACDSGAKSDGVAQYISNKLRVEVLAPNQKAIVEKKPTGETIVYSGSEIGKHDGKFVPFTPQDEVKK